MANWYRNSQYPIYYGGSSGTTTTIYSVAAYPIAVNNVIYGTVDNPAHHLYVKGTILDQYGYLYYSTSSYVSIGISTSFLVYADSGGTYTKIDGTTIHGRYRWGTTTLGGMFNCNAMPINGIIIDNDNVEHPFNYLRSVGTSGRYPNSVSTGFVFGYLDSDGSRSTIVLDSDISSKYQNCQIVFNKPQPIPQYVYDALLKNMVEIPAYESTTSTLYTYTGERNRLNKLPYLTEVSELVGTFREDTDILHPFIRISSDTLPNFNYVYLKEFNRYYYVDNITYIAFGLWEVSLSVDVLYTYNASIRTCPVFVTRNEYLYNNKLVDNKRIIEEGVDANVLDVDNNLFGNGYDFVISGFGIGVDVDSYTMPTPTVTITGGTAKVTNFSTAPSQITYTWKMGGNIIQEGEALKSIDVEAYCKAQDLPTGTYYISVTTSFGSESKTSEQVAYSFTGRNTLPTPTITAEGIGTAWSINVSNWSEYPAGTTFNVVRSDSTVVSTFTAPVWSVPNVNDGANFNIYVYATLTGYRDSASSNIVTISTTLPTLTTPIIEKYGTQPNYGILISNYSSYTAPGSITWHIVKDGVTSATFEGNHYDFSDIGLNQKFTVAIYGTAPNYTQSGVSNTVTINTNVVQLEEPDLKFVDSVPEEVEIANAYAYPSEEVKYKWKVYLSGGAAYYKETMVAHFNVDTMLTENDAESGKYYIEVEVIPLVEGYLGNSSEALQYEYLAPIPDPIIEIDDSDNVIVTNVDKFPDGTQYTLYVAIGDGDEAEQTFNTTGRFALTFAEDGVNYSMWVIAESPTGLTTTSNKVEYYIEPEEAKSAVGTWLLNPKIDVSSSSYFTVQGTFYSYFDDIVSLTGEIIFSSSYYYDAPDSLGLYLYKSVKTTTYSNTFYVDFEATSIGPDLAYIRSSHTEDDISQNNGMTSKTSEDGITLRTIIITGGTDAENPDLIAWLKANATLQS